MVNFHLMIFHSGDVSHTSDQGIVIGMLETRIGRLASSRAPRLSTKLAQLLYESNFLIQKRFCDEKASGEGTVPVVEWRFIVCPHVCSPVEGVEVSCKRTHPPSEKSDTMGSISKRVKKVAAPKGNTSLGSRLLPLWVWSLVPKLSMHCPSLNVLNGRL